VFKISAEPLEKLPRKETLVSPQAGAYTEFEGWVRNRNEGRAVTSLEYEVFPELAQTEGALIIEEAKARFEILDIACIHRVGQLQIGEMAVWVGVTARHREAAFKACRYVIDEVKARVPIWKKECYQDGDSHWVNCVECGRHGKPTGDAEKVFYDRQVRLPQLGDAGQQTLKRSRVLVVGAGGLGCPALQYLAAAGVGFIGICDDDRIDRSNLHRQILFNYNDVDRLKVDVAAERLRTQNPFIEVEPIAERVGVENVEGLVAGYDIVIDGTDNFKTKFLLHDACFMAGIPLVHAAIYQFEGQLQVFRPTAGTGCLRCLWPIVPEEGCVGACAEVGVLGAVPGVIGGMQATETLKILLGLPGVSDDVTLLIDLASCRTDRVTRPRDPNCPLCGETPQIQQIETAHYSPDITEPWVVDLAESRELRLQQFEIVDVRSLAERADNPDWMLNLRHLTATDIEPFKALDPARDYLLACSRGSRCRYLAAQLRATGCENFYFLRQGIEALEEFL
jgi:molybdopterin/thiamine biosynthesis adenylyltransferase/molybdopterin synthase catalytic subunit/rhodanese-related sulfurtransferase